MRIIILLLFILIFTSIDASPEGKFIAFVGISGSGKSTTAREIATLTGGISLHEPEESEWPEVIRNIQDYGELSSLMVFRAMRVNTLYQAQKLKEKENLVFVDSYYDKITAYYLGKPGMEWLMDPKDPYYESALQIMQLDVDLLPDADCIVLFEVSLNDWIKMLQSRNRTRDNLEGFIENYNLYKKYIDSAVEQLCSRRNIKLIRFQQNFSSPGQQAEKLKRKLIEEKILEKT